jgi:hypothetical protein
MAKHLVLPAATVVRASTAKAVVPVVNVQKQLMPIKAKRLRHHLHLHSAKRQQRRAQDAREERRVVVIAGNTEDKLFEANIIEMRNALPLILLITSVFVAAFSATAQKAYLHLNNKGSDTGKRYDTANDSVLAAIKNAFIANNAKIIEEDASTITAEMPNSVWAWESKDGSPDNDRAIVVINKKYDIGSNQIKKPKSVTTIWLVTISADKKSYLIKLQDVLSIYPKNTKTKTGYSTGLYEEKIATSVK